MRQPVQQGLFGPLEAEEPFDPADLRARFCAGTVVPGSLLSRASLRVRVRERGED